MISFELMKRLSLQNESKIVFIVADGLGGLAMKAGGKTELETARTPNLDRLAARSSCGLVDPITPGITPGSGPAHLALFGYDPLEFDLGRGILSTFGIRCFQKTPMNERNVAARMNFATLENGLITDRRAGRVPDREGRRLASLLDKGVGSIDGVKVTVEHEKEYRGALILEARGLSGKILDTDPGLLNKPPITPAALKGLPRAEAEKARKTAAVVKKFVQRAAKILAKEHPANFVLLRGFDKFRPLPQFQEVYKLNPAAVATYPMYRGVARLLGMEVLKTGTTIKDELKTLRENFADHDYFFFHVKKTDSAGEDGDFDAKVRVIEEMDAVIPGVLKLKPDVLMITGDHSTPALLKSHSWHPLPVLVYSKYARRDSVRKFGEGDCAAGCLGRIRATDLMPIAMANALKLAKYGA